MIDNKSVRILTTIKKIWIILFAALATAFFILGIIAAVQAPAENKAVAIVTLIFGLIGMGIGGYLVYLLFDFLINRRQENLNYMNARLNNKKNDDNKETK